MALVMKNEMVSDYLTKKMAVSDGVMSTVSADGVTHMDIMTYPAQGDFSEGAVLALIKKPFIDFAASCGGAGAMTTEKMTEKYGDQIPAGLAKTIADDFSRAYGNYVIIPNGMTLMITAAPIMSVFDIMVKDEPSADAE